MVILDTDHVSLLEWAENPEAQRLRARLEILTSETIATTIISFEEQTRGWLTSIAKSRTMAQQLQAYARLKRHLLNYCRVVVLDFGETAAAEFQRLRKSRLRIGTMDLKIAAVVVAHDATLLSRNLKDFRKVPGLMVEDWTL
jgi:tRNA(fMet)-specific endonuclease VapC